MNSILRCFIVTGLLFPIVNSQAQEELSPLIPGYERFRAKDLSAEVAGQLLISELNCQSCHGAVLSELLPQRQAPVLTHVGSRVQFEHLQQFIANPRKVKPGTAMPHLLSGDHASTQATALAHFLASSGNTVPTPVSASAIARGEQQFHTFGCAACHGDLRKPALERPAYAMPLGTLETKYTVSSLIGFLKDPHVARPSGRMPSLNLNDEEARNIASYLLQNVDVEPNLTVDYYEGSWDVLPDFDQLKPHTSGPASAFDVSVSSKKENFGLRFRAWLHLPKDAEYQFWLGSDDGSRLVVDGEDVINADGVHPHQEKTAKRSLTAGPHPVVVEYFEKGGEESLKVEIAGPGISRQPLAGLVSNSREAPEAQQAFQVDADLVATGRQLFVSVGCASCHHHEALGDDVRSSKKYPQFASLDLSHGCLADDRTPGVPAFHLSKRQTEDITEAVTSLGKKRGDADNGAKIQQVMLTLNCLGCHQREKLGGVPRDFDHLFTGSIPEMGDEGRVPPHLDGIGDKLQESWLREVMNNGTKDRPYMTTRMPKFGQKNVGQLITLFASSDVGNTVAEVSFEDPPHRVKSAARLLVGDKALSCIKCHYFDKHKATGIQSLDMTTMTKRLRRDWFHRYLLNPQAFRAGTRMPAAWPRGKSVIPAVLHGNSGQQIEAIWQYLADGNKARVPSGLGSTAIELKPTASPIIYRNFIEGLSARGIAVGFPEGAHFAWDAEQMNLKLIWQGEFIDAAKHWVGRGPGYQSPLGDGLMSMVSGQLLAVLTNAEEKWPAAEPRTAGYRFRGYTLNEKRQPAFKYDWKNVRVVDFISPEAGDRYPYLVRTLTLKSEDELAGVSLRLAASKQIERVAGGWQLDNGIQLKGLPNAKVRDSEDRQELVMVPGAVSDLKITYEIHW